MKLSTVGVTHLVLLKRHEVEMSNAFVIVVRHPPDEIGMANHFADIFIDKAITAQMGQLELRMNVS